MSTELVAVLAVCATQLAVVVAVAGLMLSSQAGIRAELREIRQELGDMRKDIAGLRKEIGELRERMARLEGMFEIFARAQEKEPA